MGAAKRIHLGAAKRIRLGAAERIHLHAFHRAVRIGTVHQDDLTTEVCGKSSCNYLSSMGILAGSNKVAWRCPDEQGAC